MQKSLLPLALFLAGATIAFAAPPPVHDTLTETEIGPYPKHVTRVLASPDLKHYAISEQQGETFVISYDGKVIANSSSEPKFLFSPDSKRFAFFAEHDKKFGGLAEQRYYSVIDGHEIPSAMAVTFSDDSRHVAFRIAKTDGQSIVFDNSVSREFSNISSPVISPNSKRIAYAGSKNVDWFVFLDGQTVNAKPCRYVRAVFFSPDSKHLAYYADIGHIPTSLSCVARDGVNGTVYDSVQFTPPFFSPDSRHLAYFAVQDKALLLVMDGKETLIEKKTAGLPHDELAFSPDSKSFAYFKDGRVVVNTGGVEKAFATNSRNGMAFSPDSRRFAYIVHNKADYAVAENGTPGKDCKNIITRSLTFSPDSKHLLYVTFDNDSLTVVVDGKECEPVDSLLPLAPLSLSGSASYFAFTPHSAAVEYLAVRDRKLYRIHAPLVSK